MISYAINDTHYLLYVYDCLRKDVWNSHGREGVEAVMDASRKFCSSRYEKEYFWPLGYRKLLDGPRRAAPKAITLTDTQDAVMAVIWDWRDAIGNAHMF